VRLLEQALEAARRAHDLAHQATALDRLVAAHWESGAHRAAVVAMGELVNLVGLEEASRRSPAGLVADLDGWSTALVEGRARATQVTSP
jgi:hypothetical protein